MSNDRRRLTRRTEIERLSNQLNTISAQLNQLILDEHREEEEEQDYSIGDRVRILNNYRGLRGAIGTVVSVTQQQVRIQVDGREDQRPVSKKKTNIERVIESQQ